jgi:hypothetical protein
VRKGLQEAFILVDTLVLPEVADPWSTNPHQALRDEAE